MTRMIRNIAIAMMCTIACAPVVAQDVAPKGTVISQVGIAPVLSGAASADGDDQNPQTQPPSTAAPSPHPPPPLFLKHRRGLYKDAQGYEAVDATPQSPPLETDDPNVPDKGEWEINLITVAGLSKEAKRVDLLLVDANYGVLPKIAGHELPTQVKFEFPVSAARAGGDPFRFGVGAAKFGLKVNFYTDEQKGLSMSVYPQIEFALPGGAVEKGMAEPGQRLILPLCVSKEFHYFTFVANGGVEKPFHDPEGAVAGTFGVGFGRAITRRLAAMIEVHGESAFTPEADHQVFLNVGVIRAIGNVVVYANWGHSIITSDGVSYNQLGFGTKLVF
jgi:hypothetical protein